MRPVCTLRQGFMHCLSSIQSSTKHAPPRTQRPHVLAAPTYAEPIP